jgi:hypothetical protein
MIMAAGTRAWRWLHNGQGAREACSGAEMVLRSAGEQREAGGERGHIWLVGQ